MPRGDGTGPNGMGPMTGRAAGYCTGHRTPGFANNLPGRSFGMGLGRGGGRGWRNRYYATGLPGGMRFGYGAGSAAPPAYFQQPEAQEERRLLENQQALLQQQLASIKERIAELEPQEAQKE